MNEEKTISVSTVHSLGVRPPAPERQKGCSTLEADDSQADNQIANFLRKHCT